MGDDSHSDRMVDRIGKLLGQAEGTDNEHEAAAFVERAQQLATDHAVDLERARRKQADRQRQGAQPALVQERLEVGRRGLRGNRHRVLLYLAVARPNDVLVNVATDSSYLLGFGHRTDLEVVERLWSSLAVQMTVAAQQRLDRGEHRVVRVGALTWRLSFYDGYVQVVAERLTAARERALAQADPASGPEPDSASLVLRAKGARVQDFYQQTSSARGTWRGASTGRTRASSGARQSGRTEGRRADIGQARISGRGQIRA